MEGFTLPEGRDVDLRADLSAFWSVQAAHFASLQPEDVARGPNRIIHADRRLASSSSSSSSSSSIALPASRSSRAIGAKERRIRQPMKFRHPIPLRRVKNIMKSDEDVSGRALKAETVSVVAEAAQLFALELGARGCAEARKRKGKMLTYDDLANGVAKAGHLDFVQEFVRVKQHDKKKRPKKKQGENPSGDAPGSRPVGEEAAVESAAPNGGKVNEAGALIVAMRERAARTESDRGAVDTLPVALQTGAKHQLAAPAIAAALARSSAPSRGSATFELSEAQREAGSRLDSRVSSRISASHYSLHPAQTIPASVMEEVEHASALGSATELTRKGGPLRGEPSKRQKVSSGSVSQDVLPVISSNSEQALGSKYPPLPPLRTQSSPFSIAMPEPEFARQTRYAGVPGLFIRHDSFLAPSMASVPPDRPASAPAAPLSAGQAMSFPPPAVAQLNSNMFRDDGR